jgi:hypothetical protein
MIQRILLQETKMPAFPTSTTVLDSILLSKRFIFQGAARQDSWFVAIAI